jgi:DmsE family decaheme c-type cytochrome
MRLSLSTAAAALAGGAALLFAQLAFAQEPPPGNPRCIKCHEEEYAVINQTRHGAKGDTRTPMGTGRECEACHGDATAHADNRGKTPVPNRFLGKEMTADQKSGVCLNCHAGNRHLTFWESGRHRKNEVACNNCHNPHAAPPPAALSGALQRRDATISPFVTTVRQLQYETCVTCHKQIRAQLLKPSHHPIIEGKVKCSDCHNPHGALSPSMVKNESINQLCTTCHADKRGPYMFEHPPVEQNCLTCHNSHGSSHGKLLNEKVPNLCQDCHDWSRHPGTFYSGKEGFAGGNPASTLGVPSSQGTNNTRFIARACVNCHNQIHGSNGGANRGQFFIR